MLQEFKEFALRGNVVDMAVGIVIGAAFSTIVRSLVDDIVMPPMGVVTGGVDFSNMFIALNGGDYASLAQARQAGAPTLNFGLFINNVISFLIVAFVLFMVGEGHEPVAPQAGGRAADRAPALARGAAPGGDQGCARGWRYGPEAASRRAARQLSKARILRVPGQSWPPRCANRPYRKKFLHFGSIGTNLLLFAGET